MNAAARIYMQNLLSDRVKYLAGMMLNCPPDDTAGLLALAGEAKDAANALHELNQPAEAQKPAAEIRKMSDVFTAVARNVQEMRNVRHGIESNTTTPDLGRTAVAVVTDILTAFNPEKEALTVHGTTKKQRAGRDTHASILDNARAEGRKAREEYEVGLAPTPEQLQQTIGQIAERLASAPPPSSQH